MVLDTGEIFVRADVLSHSVTGTCWHKVDYKHQLGTWLIAFKLEVAIGRHMSAIFDSCKSLPCRYFRHML